jgi:hypothetical protein
MKMRRDRAQRLPTGPSATTLAIANRRLLDYKPPLRNLDDKRRVVELTSGAVVDPRDNVLEGLSVEPDRVTPRSEREPVEINSGFHLTRHCSTIPNRPSGRGPAEAEPLLFPIEN